MAPEPPRPDRTPAPRRPVADRRPPRVPPPRRREASPPGAPGHPPVPPLGHPAPPRAPARPDVVRRRLPARALRDRPGVLRRRPAPAPPPRQDRAGLPQGP